MIRTDATIWNSTAGHPLQSWEWGEFRKAMGIDVARATCGQVTFHPIPYTPWVIGYFPKGSAPTQTMIGELMSLGKAKRALFIQLEPDVISTNSTPQKPLIPAHRPLFTQYNFILDLTKSEDALLQAMHPKTRYNLKVAKKHAVTIQEDNSIAAFNEYLRLSQETTERQGFFAHNKRYHKTMWGIMHKAGIAHLFTATYQGETLAAWIIFSWKKTLYYPYGASSRQHREVMAPTLLLWEIARWGKSNGYTAFDLWGALGPTASGQPDPHDPWFGFHRFKQGFNPQFVEYTGSFDLVIHPLLYKLYTLADTIRWFFLKRSVRTQ